LAGFAGQYLSIRHGMLLYQTVNRGFAISSAAALR